VTESQLFAPAVNVDRQTMANTPMGERAPNGRYRMPLLPGETPPKSVKGADWVPGGVQSMTNLASSISDTKALGDWKLEQALIGVGLHPELARELMMVVHAAREQGVNFQDLRSHPMLRSQLAAIAEKAWDIGGANAARDAGIAAHTAWEQRAPGIGQQPRTQLFAQSFGALEQLLADAGLERVPGLSERVVRNVELNAAGRFDDILLVKGTRRLLMADLKTKSKPFWSFLEIDAQLAGYATAEWMLDSGRYVKGPKHYVDQTEGVVLHMPSAPDDDGNWQVKLRRADLVRGMKTMRLAREVCTQRSGGKSAGRFGESYWPINGEGV
jgi:hypothetical protein